jgi:predicted metal-dependent peptidase
MIDKGHPKITACINKLIMSGYSYFGEFSLFVNFEQRPEIKTVAVNIKNCTPFYYYNPKFIDTLTDEEMMFIHMHELYHLLCDHINRRGGREFKLSNVAMDMIINSGIKDHNATHPSAFFKLSTPKNALFLPETYTGKPIFEELYDWLKEQRDKYRQDSEDVPEELEELFDNLEDYEFDTHMEDEGIDYDVRKEVIDNIKSNLFNRGLVNGNAQSFLDKLEKPKKDYLRDIIRSISSVKGYYKKKSFRQLNRKNLYGLKGKIKYGSRLNVILDTSGSMNGYFEKIISVIFRDSIEINLIQCDTIVQSVEEIKSKRELQKVMIKGLGGTIIQPAIDEVVKKYNDVNTLILTDGFTDNLNVSSLKGCLLISTGVIPQIRGKCKTIILEQDEK